MCRCTVVDAIVVVEDRHRCGCSGEGGTKAQATEIPMNSDINTQLGRIMVLLYLTIGLVG